MNRKSKAITFASLGLLLSGTVLAANMPRGIPEPNSPTMATPSDKRPVLTENSVDFGAYDPHGDFGTPGSSKIEHLFLPWEDVDLSTLTLADDYAQARGRSLMITIEPWSWSPEWRVTEGELLRSILSGERDENMARVCSAAAALKSPVIIRWGQEMDETDNQFPGRIGGARTSRQPIAAW